MADSPHDKTLALMRMRGPVLPVDVAKAIETTSMLASAVLSELKSTGRIKISSVKVGGSPLYYLKGQETQLEKYKDKLNEKDQRTFDLLRQRKVLRDKPQTPLVRVSLRQIKDFAVPLSVKTNAGEELFWRWHTLSNDEVSPLIKKELGITEEKPTQKPIPVEEVPKPLLKTEVKKEKQAKLEEPKEKPAEVKKEKPKSDFYNDVVSFLNANKIEIIEEKIIKKKTEFEFVVAVPSAIGKSRYFCKAKNKKKINEGDLSTTYVQAGAKKLPALFIGPGTLSKRAEEMLNREFDNLTFKQM